jgi:hypothetical protein
MSTDHNEDGEIFFWVDKWDHLLDYEAEQKECPVIPIWKDQCGKVVARMS